MQWIFVITNSLLTSALAEYWLLKTVKIKNYVEILGVTGGILKIFQAINHSLGVILLKMFKHLIEKENRKLKQLKENTNEHTRLESKERENIRHDDINSFILILLCLFNINIMDTVYRKKSKVRWKK